MKKIIHVTEEDIRSGTVSSYNKCPIALALTRITRVGEISVGRRCTVIWYNDEWKEVKLSWRARRFIHRFDAGKKVHPFSFKLKVD